MKVGIVSLYSFRPHVEHLAYLAKILLKDNHEVEFFTCDGRLSTCHSLLLKGKPKLVGCSECIVGGLRSYFSQNIYSLNPKLKANLDLDILTGLAKCSAFSLHRVEQLEDQKNQNVLDTIEKFYDPINTIYANVQHWIKEKAIDGVICFNVRMTLPLTVAKACSDLAIPYIACERPFLGDGLLLKPNEGCLELPALNSIVKEYSEKPLMKKQLDYSIGLIATRFKQKNSLDWRLYNPNPINTSWPTSTSRKKILIIPSSRYEFEGQAGWDFPFSNAHDGFQYILSALDVTPEQVVVRYHPNWAMNIGVASGTSAIEAYDSWVKEHDYFAVDSSSRLSTHDLIKEADIVIVNGSTAAIEAGILGKKIICVGHAFYEQAGFTINILNKNFTPKDVDDLKAIEVQRKTLRYCYSLSKRFPQYMDFVKAEKTTRYLYKDGGSSQIIIDMFKNNKLIPSDTEFALNTQSEDDLLQELNNEIDWNKYLSYALEKPIGSVIKRRFPFEYIAKIRDLLPQGDR